MRSTAEAVTVRVGAAAAANFQLLPNESVLPPDTFCMTKIEPVCPATQFDGFSNVLLPVSMTAKFCEALKSTAMDVPSVRLTMVAMAAPETAIFLPKFPVPKAAALTLTIPENVPVAAMTEPVPLTFTAVVAFVAEVANTALTALVAFVALVANTAEVAFSAFVEFVALEANTADVALVAFNAVVAFVAEAANTADVALVALTAFVAFVALAANTADVAFSALVAFVALEANTADVALVALTAFVAFVADEANTAEVALVALTAFVAFVADAANTADVAFTAFVAFVADVANTALTALVAFVALAANTAEVAFSALVAFVALDAKTAEVAFTAFVALVALAAKIALTFVKPAPPPTKFVALMIPLTVAALTTVRTFTVYAETDTGAVGRFVRFEPSPKKVAAETLSVNVAETPIRLLVDANLVAVKFDTLTETGVAALTI
jgi:hypothetical protein